MNYGLVMVSYVLYIIEFDLVAFDLGFFFSSAFISDSDLQGHECDCVCMHANHHCQL